MTSYYNVQHEFYTYKMKLILGQSSMKLKNLKRNSR